MIWILWRGEGRVRKREGEREREREVRQLLDGESSCPNSVLDVMTNGFGLAPVDGW